MLRDHFPEFEVNDLSNLLKINAVLRGYRRPDLSGKQGNADVIVDAGVSWIQSSLGAQFLANPTEHYLC